MNFPFSTAIDYLTPEQRDAFQLFLAELPEGNVMYVNDKGEERQVMRVSYPIGCVTPDTLFTTVKGERRYYTDGACEPGGYAMVAWRSADKKVYTRCNSREWFEWLGTDYKTRPLDPVQPNDDILRARKAQAAMNGMLMRRQKAQEEVDRHIPKTLEKKSASKTR